jgi:hypothetical protein
LGELTDIKYRYDDPAAKIPDNFSEILYDYIGQSALPVLIVILFNVVVASIVLYKIVNSSSKGGPVKFSNQPKQG